MPNENNRDDRPDTIRGGEQGGPQGGTPGIRDEQRGGTGGEGQNTMRGGESTGTIRSEGRPEGRTEGRTEARTAGEGQPRQKQRRGFAAMDPAKQREIASKGGKASHEQGTGHEWDSESAREAGRKGGQASRGGRGKIRSTDSATGGETTEVEDITSGIGGQGPMGGTGGGTGTPGSSGF